MRPEEFKQWPSAHLHTQWPGTGKPGDPDFDQFYASQFPSIVSFPKQQELNRDALVALLDKIGPSILLTHSQSGSFNWPVADLRPQLLKALVAVEPSGPPVHDIENTGAPDWFKDAERTKVSGLADVPLTYDPPLTADAKLEFVRQDKADKPELVRCWLQKEPARKLPNLAAHPDRDRGVGGVLSRALRPLHVGLPERRPARTQHAHPARGRGRARQRPHDDDREEQRRDRGGHRAVARPAETAVERRRPRVIAGLDPEIHRVETNFFKMDARVKPAHDESMLVAPGIRSKSKRPSAISARGRSPSPLWR